MKFCKENIDKLEYIDGYFWRQRFEKSTKIWVYKESCKVCGDPFLYKKSNDRPGLYCSRSCTNKGRDIKPYTRKPFSVKHKKKLSIAKKGKPSPRLGIRTSYETRKKQSMVKLKQTEKEWTGFTIIGDRQIRKSLDYKQWRDSVFERDNYTCQICNKHGCYLEAHHIFRFAEYAEIRFELWNGISLCKNCHNYTKFKEEQFSELFLKITKKEDI